MSIHGGLYFVKSFHIQNRWHRVLSMFGWNRARKEFENARHLETLGIPTARPAGYGVTRIGVHCLESCFVSSAIEGETALERMEREWQTPSPSTPPHERRRLTFDLAQRIADLHIAGIEHRDIHERNLFLQSSDDGPDRFVLLDLREARLHRRLPWLAAVRDMRRLGRYFSIRTSRSDRLRFYLHYHRLRHWPERDRKRRAREVERQTMESRAEFWRRRDAKSAQGCDIVHRQGKGWSVFATEGLPEQFLQQCLRDPATALEARVQRRLKFETFPRVSEILLPDDSRPRFVWKAYRSAGWRGVFASIFRRDPAMRAWCNARSLALREIPTPTPILLVRQKRWGIAVESHLVTNFVEGEPIDIYLDRIAHLEKPTDRRRAIRGTILTVAHLIRRMHERGVTHHDFKSSNLLASETQDAATPRLWVLDLDSVTTWLRPPERERVQNVARLAASFHGHACLTRTDRLRFLRAYLGHDRFREKRWKPLWRKIAEWVERKVTLSRRVRSAENLGSPRAGG